MDALNTKTLQTILQAAACNFNLGEFRHGTDSVGMDPR